MKAVGQTFKIGFGVRRNIPELVASDSIKRRVLAARVANQQTREPALHVKNALRKSDIDDHDTRCELRVTLSGGSSAPSSVRRTVPSVPVSSINVSGATRVSPGGAMNDFRSAVPIAGIDPASRWKRYRLNSQQAQCLP